MKNLNSELSRILTLMEVKDISSLPLIIESSEIKQILKVGFENMDLDKKKECLNTNKYPALFAAGITTACIVAFVVIVAVSAYASGGLTLGLLATELAGLGLCGLWAKGEWDDVMEKIGSKYKDERVKTEAISCSKCLGIYEDCVEIAKKIDGIESTTEKVSKSIDTTTKSIGSYLGFN